MNDETYDPRNIDPDTGLPYGSPCLEDKMPNEHFTESGQDWRKCPDKHPQKRKK